MSDITITLTEIVDGVSVESTPTSITVFDGVFVDSGGGGGGGAVDSVNGETGVVVLSASDVGAATSAQGALADTAVQPADLATVATTGAYADLTGKPSIPDSADDIGAVPTTRTVNGHALSADVTVTKSDVSLGSVDNTADAAKAVLSATKLTTARAINGVSFDGSADITVADSTKVPTTRTVAGHALSADVTVSKSDVGLGNVDNTADTAKPVSTAQQTALDLKLAKASNLSDLANAGTARTNLGVPPSTRSVAAGSGLTGGGDLSADRTLAADFGTGAGKVTQGNDSRLSDARTPTAHASSHAAGGSDPVALDASQVTRTTNAQTGTTYTLVLTDAQKFVSLSNASAITLTVPPNSSVAFPVGTEIILAQLGAGQVTIAAGAGVTLNSTPGLKIAAQYGTAALKKTATDTWLVFGRLSA